MNQKEMISSRNGGVVNEELSADSLEMVIYRMIGDIGAKLLQI